MELVEVGVGQSGGTSRRIVKSELQADWVAWIYVFGFTRARHNDASHVVIIGLFAYMMVI